MDEKTIIIHGMSERIVGEIQRNSGIKDDLLRQERAASLAASDADDANRLLRKEKKKNKELQEALAQKDELLKEWMHSHFSFRLLAKKYGGRLGISDEQRQKDFDGCILEITEERPEFAETKIAKAVKADRGLK